MQINTSTLDTRQRLSKFCPQPTGYPWELIVVNMLPSTAHTEFCCSILSKGLHPIITCYRVFVFMKCYLKFKYNTPLDKICVTLNNFHGIRNFKLKI